MTLAMLLCLVALQEEEYVDEGMDMPIAGQDMPQGQPGGAQPAAKAADPNQIRMAKFLQSRFDRRESSIMKAFAAPKEPPPDVPPIWLEIARPMPGPGYDPLPRKDWDQRIGSEIERIQRHVTLGEWAAVKQWIAERPPDMASKIYDQLLTSLLMPQMPVMEQPQPWQMLAMQMGLVPPPMQLQPRQIEQNIILPDDVLQLADASPVPLTPDSIKKLALMLKMALLRGNFVEPFVARLQAGTERLGGKDPERRNAAVKLLIAADRMAECGKLLPTPEEAASAKEADTPNLMARYHLSLHEKEKKSEHLERAWTATQAVLAMPKVEPAARQEALERVLRLVSEVRDTLGKAWVEESFTKLPELGVEILAATGSLASTNRHKGIQERLALIRLQSLAGEAMLRSRGGRAPEWTATLNLAALTWLREAELTRAAQPVDDGPEYDDWGNFYYRHRSQRPQAPQVLETADLLQTLPGDAWMGHVDPSLQPRFLIMIAQLHLKAGHEDKAFAFLERVASAHPKEGRDLAHEFLTVWTNNHDPNKDRRRTSRYMYFYGYNPRADGIPLTRSQQVRNLDELSAFVKRLRALNFKDLDEKYFVSAFVASHSAAEVYRYEDMERVFGSIDSLKPEVLAQLLQTMRANLGGIWRKPDVQQQKGTKRKDKEIQAEVIRGYAVAARVLEVAVRKHPEHWAVRLAEAAIAFDENVFHAGLSRSPDYSPKRQAAFASFQKAAELYAKAMPSIQEPEQTSEVYEIWFYASLGAADIAGLKSEQPVDASQQEIIRAAILALPGTAAERHLGRFANALQTRLTSVAAELKHRYLKAGLAIVKDHKTCRDARKVFEYYDDLVSELKLHAHVDGPTVVGHGRPFGLFVDLRHTVEIERESGGFQKYLQNQNTGGGWYWNFGRSPIDYRDRFEETAREALRDRFEVLSVTFHSDKIESRGDPQPGWRMTPYAYVLMKARGPEVDAIPPLRLDLDFLDTSGFCVLPIESAKIPIDASKPAGAPRPLDKLKIAQTLDERKAKEGKFALEIRASARGLVPELDALLDLAPPGFEIVKTDDAGASVASMDAESEVNAALTEHTWTVEMRVKPGVAQKTFRFGRSRAAGAEMVYQRYVDADLSAVTEEVDLENLAGRRAARWPWFAAGLCGVAILGAVALVRRLRRTAAPVRAAYELPSDLNPFSVLTLLRRMRRDARLAELAGPLDESIARIEQHFFNRGAGDAPDLRQLAEGFVRRTGNGNGA